jgi:mRNA interferase HigB
MLISNKYLIENYIDTHADSKMALARWVELIENAHWENPNDLKEDFPNADGVGNHRYVFNIKGNSFRLIAVVIFLAGVLTIRFIGTHAEYSKIKDCSII